jgi:putative tryptophan/tyrosine transport system substrate-binding protein
MKQFWIFHFGFSIGRSGSKKALCFVFRTLLFALSMPVMAQQAKKIPQIGFLHPGLPERASDPQLEGFRQGLRVLGYAEGQNIAIEYRFAEGKLDRLPDLATELVRLKVDIIVAAGGTPAILAAKNATGAIPIVFPAVSDPVALGIVASLARPGGNITGLTIRVPEFSGKRLELLKEVVPWAKRVAVLGQEENAANALDFKEMQPAASALGVELHRIEVRSPNDLEVAFSRMTGTVRSAALLLQSSTLFFDNRKRIADLATRSRLPAIYDASGFADAGVLMSYGSDRFDLYRRAATYIDKILKGAKPADLPVEQPMKFELVINLKTAKQIGLTIPPNVLARADRVIK